MRREPNRH